MRKIEFPTSLNDIHDLCIDEITKVLSGNKNYSDKTKAALDFLSIYTGYKSKFIRPQEVVADPVAESEPSKGIFMKVVESVKRTFA